MFHSQGLFHFAFCSWKYISLLLCKYNNINILIILITWGRVWYDELCQEQANSLQAQRVIIKPESEISCYITLKSVISVFSNSEKNMSKSSIYVGVWGAHSRNYDKKASPESMWGSNTYGSHTSNQLEKINWRLTKQLGWSQSKSRGVRPVAMTITREYCERKDWMWSRLELKKQKQNNTRRIFCSVWCDIP